MNWRQSGRRLRLSPQQSTIVRLIVAEDLTTDAIRLASGRHLRRDPHPNSTTCEVRSASTLEPTSSPPPVGRGWDGEGVRCGLAGVSFGDVTGSEREHIDTSTDLPNGLTY